MGLKIKSRLLMIALFLLPSSLTMAIWQGPSELISGSWGSGENQFGIEYGDTNDVFGGPIYVLKDGKIILSDLMNGRMKVYSNNGLLIKTVICVKTIDGEWNEECRINGNYIQMTKDGNIWTDLSEHREHKYALYFSTGELIKTTTEWPKELGWSKTKPLGGGQYHHTIQYPDASYSIVSDKEYSGLFRDENKFVYLYLPGLVDKFNTCGKHMGRLLLPGVMDFKEETAPGEEQYVFTHDEYGEPVLDVHGNVYTWKKSPSKYSILKWTWQDDPNAPADVPDAPQNLTASAAASGITLNWKKSLQDPGCVTGYEIARSLSSGSGFSTLGSVDKGVFTYSDTTAEAGTMYYYKVRAVGGDGQSAYSNEASGQY